MRQLSEGFVAWLFGFLALVLIALMVYGSVLSSREWEAFKVDHKCKLVGTISGSAFNTFAIGANGQPSVGVGVTPEKKGWACDDGVTYWK